MKVGIAVFAILGVGIIGFVLMLGAAAANCNNGADSTLYGGTYDGPGSLGGVLGTGVTAAEITAARKHPLGGTTVVPSSNYVTTAYAPAAGGINCDVGGRCGSTASGIRVDGGKRRAYIVASNPRMNKYGAFAYIWPNPYGWTGPFVVADTGGNFDGSDGRFRIDFYVWGDKGETFSNKWGRRSNIRVSSEPIVSSGTANAAASSSTQLRISNASYVTTAASTAPSSLQMTRPTTGPYTSPFGQRWGRLHAGVDIAPPAGTPIVAALAGTVVFRGEMSGYGNFTCIRHAAKLTTCYGHQQRFASSIRVGTQVTQGQLIGYVGSTGHSTGPHLHFEVRLGPDFSGRPVDPMPYLKGAVSVDPDTSALADSGQQCSVNTPATAAAGVYVWPVSGGSPSKGIIGTPGQGTHSFTAPPNNWQSDNAIDIGTPVGTPLVAVDDGTISSSLGFGTLTGDGSSRFAGIRFHLVDSHNNTWYYAHLKKVVVKPGQQVQRGQLVGYSGSANGVAHLHLASKDGDPTKLLGVVK